MNYAHCHVRSLLLLSLMTAEPNDELCLVLKPNHSGIPYCTDNGGQRLASCATALTAFVRRLWSSRAQACVTTPCCTYFKLGLDLLCKDCWTLDWKDLQPMAALNGLCMLARSHYLPLSSIPCASSRPTFAS